VKILLVSSQWAPKHQTGLGFASQQHAQYFLELGYELKCVSLNDDSKDFDLKITNRLHLIANYKKKKEEIKNIINDFKPDIIAVESLQSLISEIFLFYGFKLNCKTILISHGISILPHKISIKYIIKSLVYFFYLPILVYIAKKIDILFTLKKKDFDLRHLDTVFFLIFNKKKIKKKFNNISRFEENKKTSINQNNKPFFLCIGYLNDIKNQKQVLDIAKKNNEFNFRLIYSTYDPTYLRKLKKIKTKYQINNVIFVSTDETNIKDEIKNCVAVINTSITEVQPLSIIEGFSFGKMYLSNNIKNLMHLKCGIVNKNSKQFIFNLKSLNENKDFKKEINNSIRDYYHRYFSTKINSKNFIINDL
jgi:hypothetical protein